MTECNFLSIILVLQVRYSCPFRVIYHQLELDLVQTATADILNTDILNATIYHLFYCHPSLARSIVGPSSLPFVYLALPRGQPYRTQTQFLFSFSHFWLVQ
jgi:hypothetical protein